jgi:Aminoglycoside-2''-adenylyltransferase
MTFRSPCVRICLSALSSARFFKAYGSRAQRRRWAMTQSVDRPEMTAEDVCDFLAQTDGHGIRIWLDGGWAVDACLGSQTRHHSDLDIVIEERHLALVTTALERRGYAPVPRPDTRAWNFVLGDAAGRQIDFHVIVLDENGRGRYSPPGAMRLTRLTGQTCPRSANALVFHSFLSTADSPTQASAGVPSPLGVTTKRQVVADVPGQVPPDPHARAAHPARDGAE